MIGVFDRSHYEDVLIARVRELVADDARSTARYGAINDFEKRLVDEGTVVVKCMLHISAEEQKRAAARPARRPDQAVEVQPRATSTSAQLWADYQAGLRDGAGADQHRRTRRGSSCPSDRKWYRNLAVGRLLRETLPRMDPSWPGPDYDVEEQRRRLTDEGRRTGRAAVIRTVSATRYVTPLREGGSLPGIVEADDLGTYVCKFRGAGQGLKVLVAEVVVGELARGLGIAHPGAGRRRPRPRRSARYEADEEVQDLLTASLGLNLGVDFLPGSFGYDAGYVAGPGRRGVDPVAGRADRQRRPQLAQPEPARLARRPVGDRPRRLPVLPPRLVRRRRLGRAVRAPALRRLRPRAGRAPRRAAGGRRTARAAWSPASCSTTCSPGCPTSGSSRSPVRRRRRQLRAAYVDFLLARVERRARLAAGRQGAA